MEESCYSAVNFVYRQLTLILYTKTHIFSNIILLTKKTQPNTEISSNCILAENYNYRLISTNTPQDLSESTA